MRSTSDDLDYVKGRIEKHVDFTGSQRGKEILAAWASEQKKFVKVMPTDYKRALAELRKLAEQRPARRQAGGGKDQWVIHADS